MHRAADLADLSARLARNGMRQHRRTSPGVAAVVGEDTDTTPEGPTATPPPTLPAAITSSVFTDGNRAGTTARRIGAFG